MLKIDFLKQEAIGGKLESNERIKQFEGEDKISSTKTFARELVQNTLDARINKNKKAKLFKQIEMKNLKKMLIHEDSVAGGYDLMDIVALKIIERSKIKTRVIRSDIKNLEKAIKGQATGTEIILSKK